MWKYVLERHFDGDNQNNAILAPLIDCHDPGRTVSVEQNIHSDSVNNAERFYSIAKSTVERCIQPALFLPPQLMK